jgi:hypothetical protein
VVAVQVGHIQLNFVNGGSKGHGATRGLKHSNRDYRRLLQD